MIPVTCRNGEHFSVDPDTIDPRKLVEHLSDEEIRPFADYKQRVDAPFEELLQAVRDHRAATFIAREHLVDGYAATPNAVRLGRRNRLREGFRGGPPMRAKISTLS